MNKYHSLAASWLLCQGFSYVPVGLSNAGLSTYRKGHLTVRVDNRGYIFNNCDRDEIWEDGGLKYFKERVNAELLVKP